MNRRTHGMAALMLAVFLCSNFLYTFAKPSLDYAPEDYRHTEKLMDVYGNRDSIKKPTAAFRAYRWKDGIGLLDQLDSYSDMDFNAPYPVLTCYVGDTITFEDRSKANNNGQDRIVEWDWQQYGAMGDHWAYYDYDILGDTVLQLTEPGVTTFFLCVRSDYPVGRDSVDVWSDNGNHQTVGKNKHFPQGMYWYFSSLQLNVLPRIEGQVEVRYQDSSTGDVFYQSVMELGEFPDGAEQMNTKVHIPELSGYTLDHWSVLLPDETLQYTGTDADADVAVTTWEPRKILLVDFIPNAPTPGPGPGPNDGDINDGNGGSDESGNGNSNIDTPPLPPDPPPSTNGECDGVITWTETDSHQVKIGKYPNGKPKYRTCNHKFTYEADLTADAQLDPTVFKSGYGFSVDVNTDLTVRLKSQTGCGNWGEPRSPAKRVSLPTKALVYVPFTVTNRLGTQGSQIELERISSGGSSVFFQTPVNPISETGARRIYTDVTLPGTQEAPVNHTVDLYISGGGIDGIEFCLHLTKSYTINGDMFEDDFSGSN